MSKPEQKFLFFWKALQGPSLVPEHKFHPTRKWRFDFAYPIRRIAIEIEGGVWSGGAHTRGKGFSEDCEKYLEALLLGWRVVRLVPDQITLPVIERLIVYVKGV